MREGSRRELPWAIHLTWVGLLLLVATAYVGFDAFVYIDEAAVYAQVEVVEDGSWTVPRPLGALDAAELWAPMNNSTVVGDEFAPFPNHPLHVIVASVADRIGGSVGVRALSTLGVLGAAATAGMLASSTGRREAIAAMVIAALASPLLFDAQLVVAHALAAPLAGLLAVLVFARPHHVGASRVLAVVGVVAVGSLLRSEFVVFAAAVAAVAVATAPTGRREQSLLLSLAAIGGALGAYVLEPVWITRLVGGSTAPKVISTASRGGTADRIDSILTVLVGTGPGRSVPLVLAIVLSVVAATVLRWRPPATRLAAGVAATAASLAIAQLLSPAVVPGIIWAFPLLAVAATGARRDQLDPPVSRALLSSLVFAGAVLALQYRDAGGFEWGWRYVHISLPIVAAAMASPVMALVGGATTPDRRVVVAGVAAVTFLVPLSGVVQQRRNVEATHDLIASVDRVVDQAQPDLVVSTERLLGRYLWQQSIDGRVATTDRDDSSALLAAAHDAGFDRVLLVWAGDRPDPALAGYSAADDEVPLPEPFGGQLLGR